MHARQILIEMQATRLSTMKVSCTEGRSQASPRRRH
jgi:hypothetical protein